MSFEGLKKYRFFTLPRDVIMSAALVFVMGAILTYLLSDIWKTREDYSFGYLMPVFVLYVLYDRWAKIYSYFSSPLEPGESANGGALQAAVGAGFGITAVAGIVLFIFFGLLFIIAQGRTSAIFPMTVGFSLIFFTSAYFASAKNLAGEKMPLKRRWDFVMLFVFPAFAWIISAPVFGVVEEKISLFLLSKVAYVVLNVMDFLGYVVELRGNVIHFPSGSVGVADACSGIRSLTACLFAGSFLAAVFLDKFWKKVALVASSMVLAFLFNLVRALFLSFWAYENGADSIAGFVHDAAGYFVLGMTVVGLLLLLPLFSLSPVPKEFRDVEDGGEDGENPDDDSDKKE